MIFSVNCFNFLSVLLLRDEIIKYSKIRLKRIQALFALQQFPFNVHCEIEYVTWPNEAVSCIK